MTRENLKIAKNMIDTADEIGFSEVMKRVYNDVNGTKLQVTASSDDEAPFGVKVKITDPSPFLKIAQRVGADNVPIAQVLITTAFQIMLHTLADDDNKFDPKTSAGAIAELFIGVAEIITENELLDRDSDSSDDSDSDDTSLFSEDEFERLIDSIFTDD